MNPFKTETLLIADILQEAREKIEKIDNPDINLLKFKILSGIKKHETFLRANAGESVDNNNSLVSDQPLTSMFGKDISKYSKGVQDVNKPVIVGPTDVEMNELRAKVNEVYLRFTNSDPEQLLDSLDETIIRGVAKKAGMVVTENDPERITLKFVEEVVSRVKEKVEKESTALLDESLAPNPDTDTDTEKKPLSEEEVFKNEVDELYELLPTMTPADLLESFDHIVIRGVAKKAGMVVTENDPEKVDKAFINLIKKAIKKKADIEKAGNAGNDK